MKIFICKYILMDFAKFMMEKNVTLAAKQIKYSASNN